MTDREEFEEHADGDCLPIVRLADGQYAHEATQYAWTAWQACAAIKQRRIDELEAQLDRMRYHKTLVSVAAIGTINRPEELADLPYRVVVTSGPIPHEPQEPKP